MTIYLYVKTHNKTGLKYLGKTNSKDPYKYPGSGKYWTSHIKIHGNDVTTEILKECQTKEDIKYWGEYYSNLWNIVKDISWANLKPETGEGGGVPGIPRSKETIEKIRNKNLGKKRPPEFGIKMSQALTGKPKSEEAIKKSASSRTGLKRSDEFCKKASDRQIGIPKSADHIEKLRAWRKTDEGKEIMKKAWEKRRNSNNK